jgi:ABC-2 type transport system ATP-binding protein
MPPLIVAEQLTKWYGSRPAIDHVSLEVEAGEVMGLLGPNGSGKTTILRILTGYLRPSSGTARIAGLDVVDEALEARGRVGYVPEDAPLYDWMETRQFLTFMARLKGLTRRQATTAVDAAIERLALGDVRLLLIGKLSRGYRQRVAIAQALLGDPQLLVLDEPTNGLDPQGIKEIRELLVELNASGTTVFLSSHLLAEVEQLCTRVGVVDRGRLVLEEDLATLRAATGRILVGTPDAAAAVAVLDGQLESRDGDRLVIRHGDPAAVNAMLVEAGVRVTSIHAEQRTLEQVVLDVTGPGSDRFGAAG